MSKVEKTIQFGQQINGEVGNYATILLVDEVDDYSKIRNQSPNGNIVCCIKKPRENYSDLDLVDELTDLPIQNTLADPKGISRAAASVPNAVALSGATATPLYDTAQVHYDNFKYNSKDLNELDEDDSNTLKNILMQEQERFKDLNLAPEIGKSEKVKELSKHYDSTLSILGQPHDPCKLSLVHYFNRS